MGNYSIAELLDQIDAPIAQISGDGVDDTRGCYGAISTCGAYATIPPRCGAVSASMVMQALRQGPRDENPRRLRRIGRKHWQRKGGDQRHSLVETALFCVKTIFGDRVRSRGFEGQGVDLLIRCVALNHITHLSPPDGYAV